MEQIVSRFHTNKVPTEWLSPIITILNDDWDLIIDWVAMYEIWGGCYWYDFVTYDKAIIYLITTDWGSDDLDDRYQHIVNTLDAYENKKDRWKGGWGWGSGTSVDYGRIVKEVRNPSKKDLPKWSLGDSLSKLDTDRVIKEIINNKTDIDYEAILSFIQKGNTKVINQIKKIPDQTEQIQALAEFVDWKLNELQEQILQEAQTTEMWIKNILGNIPKEVDYEAIKSFHKEVDFSPLIKFMEWIKELVLKWNEKVDMLDIENIDYGIIEWYIKSNKDEFQNIVLTISQKLSNNEKILLEWLNNDETINHFLHLAEEIKELKAIEEKTNELNKKYLFGIYNILNGIKNWK